MQYFIKFCLWTWVLFCHIRQFLSRRLWEHLVKDMKTLHKWIKTTHLSWKQCDKRWNCLFLLLLKCYQKSYAASEYLFMNIKIIFKWKYNYWIRVRIIVTNGEIMSKFFFIHNIFKTRLLQKPQLTFASGKWFNLNGKVEKWHDGSLF